MVNEDQHDDAVLRPGQAPAALHQSLVQHAEPGEHQDPALPGPPAPVPACRLPGTVHRPPPGRRPRRSAACLAPNSLLRSDAGTTMVATVPPPAARRARWRSPVTRNSRSQSSSRFGGQLQPRYVQDHADERHQDQRQHVRNLPGECASTVDVRQVGGEDQRRPQAPVGGAGQQQAARARRVAGNPQQRRAREWYPPPASATLTGRINGLRQRFIARYRAIP